ncbi:MAG: sigma-54 interaction domain-containing protein [Polymorphobacter sp.]
MHRNGTRSNIQLPILVGKSKIIVSIRHEIEKIADTTASVLITGPSGSGKDVVAQLLHQRSCRATRPYIALNCAAVAADLLESEMFGHEAGAFTGAVKSRPGRFEAAHGGTLFLDEVGDMALAMQAKLLRVLETRIVERVGGMLPIAVDVRLIAATSVELFAAIDRGSFRSDLLYRLDVVRIEMPTLAERVEDIPLLLQHFASQSGMAPIRFDTAAIDALMRLAWPGNVRELKNLVDRAKAHYPGETITPNMLARLVRPASGALPPVPLIAGDIGPLSQGSVDLKRILNDVECAYINAALTASGGAIAASAKLLGMQRTTLIEKMRRLHIAAMVTA